MKKFFNSFKFILKAFFLIVILLLGWAFINVTNLIKGKKLQSDNQKSGDSWGADSANADVPAGGGSTHCPHVAYFDGSKFKIENDFLCGKFSHYFRTIALRPDLIRFYHSPKKYNGKLIFQLQENEAEESFINRIKFIRVAHSKNSEVIVDSGFEKFYVIDRALLKKIIPAKEVVVNGVKDLSGRFNDRKKFFDNRLKSDGLILNKNDRLEFVFSGLSRDSKPVLIIKSTFRDFMLGEAGEAEKSFLFRLFYSPIAVRIGLFAVAALYFVLGRKISGYLPAFLPIVFGMAQKSIIFSYEDETGKFKQAAINKPRAWNFSSEAVVLPERAIREDGTMRIKAEFTKRHKLAFVGIWQNETNLPYRSEELLVKSAKSSRLGDVISLVNGGDNKPLHMIPGDAVSIELEDPKISLNNGEKETYLMQSFGVYTPLSLKYKKIAGDWLKKIPAEVRAYYGQMANK